MQKKQQGGFPGIYRGLISTFHGVTCSLVYYYRCLASNYCVLSALLMFAADIAVQTQQIL